MGFKDFLSKLNCCCSGNTGEMNGNQENKNKKDNEDSNDEAIICESENEDEILAVSVIDNSDDLKNSACKIDEVNSNKNSSEDNEFVESNSENNGLIKNSSEDVEYKSNSEEEFFENISVKKQGNEKNEENENMKIKFDYEKIMKEFD